MFKKLLLPSSLFFCSLSFASLAPGDRILGSGTERGSECSFKIERIQRNSIQLSGLILGTQLHSAQFEILTSFEKYGRKISLYTGPNFASSDGNTITSYAIEMDENQNIFRFERNVWKGSYGIDRISNSACTSFRKD